MWGVGGPDSARAAPGRRRREAAARADDDDFEFHYGDDSDGSRSDGESRPSPVAATARKKRKPVRLASAGAPSAPKRHAVSGAAAPTGGAPASDDDADAPTENVSVVSVTLARLEVGSVVRGCVCARLFRPRQVPLPPLSRCPPPAPCSFLSLFRYSAPAPAFRSQAARHGPPGGVCACVRAAQPPRDP